MLLTIRIAKNDSSSNVQQPSFSEKQSVMVEGQTPPDKPDGENSVGEQTLPDKPDGENSEEKISFEKTDNENKDCHSTSALRLHLCNGWQRTARITEKEEKDGATRLHNAGRHRCHGRHRGCRSYRHDKDGFAPTRHLPSQQSR